ncbi:NAD dependent epimerase/dehydratase [Auricularia subglabra TFB-10046 SS5]|nr:NAD dependent epimerase/dehydratase [Auricularia subglabra TFB-10046 SS5]
MSAPSVYLVTGATGNQGGSVARELLRAGQRVHALVRDPSKSQAKELDSLGAVLFVGDHDDAEAITKAAAGVKGIFILPIPSQTDPEAEPKLAQLCVDVARAAGTVESLVLSSAINADKHAQWLADPEYTMKQYYYSKSAAEEVVRASGIAHWTILRAPWLDQNYIPPHSRFHYPRMHSERKLVTAIGTDKQLAHLDAHDIGRWAAAAFLDPPRFAGKALALAAENLTIGQAARALSKAAGFEITAEVIEPADWLKDTTNPLAPIHAAIATWFNKVGSSISEAELAEVKSYGIPLTTFEEFLAKNKDAVAQI